MPLVEALVGSTTSELYEAIFDVEVSSEFEFFEESDDEPRTLRSLHSRESMRPSPSPTPRRQKRPASIDPPLREPLLQRNAPMIRASPLSPLAPVPPDASSSSARSPLAMLFAQRMAPPTDSYAAASVEASVRRVEALVEDIRELPVQRLKDEMKELQVLSIFSLIEPYNLFWRDGLGPSSPDWKPSPRPYKRHEEWDESTWYHALESFTLMGKFYDLVWSYVLITSHMDGHFL